MAVYGCVCALGREEERVEERVEAAESRSRMRVVRR